MRHASSPGLAAASTRYSLELRRELQLFDSRQLHPQEEVGVGIGHDDLPVLEEIARVLADRDLRDILPNFVQESLRAACGEGGAIVAKSAIMTFLEVFWETVSAKS